MKDVSSKKNNSKKKLLNGKKMILAIFLAIFLGTIISTTSLYCKSRIHVLSAKKNALLKQKETMQKDLKIKYAAFKTKINNGNIEYYATKYLKLEKSKSNEGLFVILDKNNVFNQNNNSQLPDLFCELLGDDQKISAGEKQSTLQKKGNIY